MQNRYAGDSGDFMKLGLLRHLAAPASSGGAGLSVGLNWYLAPDENHNDDGRHFKYVYPSNRWHRSMKACDPDLIARLREVVDSERSVAALEASGALPTGSLTHNEMLDPAAGSPGRRAWHERALVALAGADLVLADPDNGIRTGDAGWIEDAQVRTRYGRARRLRRPQPDRDRLSPRRQEAGHHGGDSGCYPAR